ncbi:hypothetical protein L2E82_05798 [Cichorium intybus]|uniref:Uncharacterized protein n=1 Tax=Cichorium intybus TaxID=13427 RepID=A0ACB9H882_CICIN|nr:hypothetical protein L2E82_05798 [Cichorium intybus]
MSRFFPRSFLIYVIIIIITIIQSKILACSCSSSSSCQHHHIHHHTNPKFEQKTTIFWEFEEESKTWVQVKSPKDLYSCVNDTTCAIVGIIEPIELDQEQEQKSKKDGSIQKKKIKKDEKKIGGLASRKRISLIKMSEDSIWVTGVSGSIYERFWNGVQWVIAPHELPVQAGYAVSVFLVNHTVLALSEAGILYQIQLSENSQPIWVEYTPILDSTTTILIKSGVISHDRERIYFCTKNGLLLELSETDPPRWINHGKPRGAVVAAVVDAAGIRPQVIFTISLSGDLYEFDRSSKPLWKKHIWSKESGQDTALTPSTGCTAHRRTGSHSDSIFLLTKGGNLVERRLHRRKWKWLLHGSPKDQKLTSITLIAPDETHTNTNTFSLFLTTASGSVFEYNISKQQDVEETWVNHTHPPHAKVAKGISGLNYQPGRLVFPLDDGRLGELHQSKTGGDVAGPAQIINTRRRVSTKYTWSIIDAPESEGWNAEYCTEDRGPLNCISGVKDDTWSRTRSKTHENYYYYITPPGKSNEKTNLPQENSVNTNKDFRLRVMHEGRSFFLVTESGLIYEYLNVENVWFWLHHEYRTGIKGAVGNYNGSLFFVDENSNLLIRERSGNELTWINCTGVKKGRQVTVGPPWNPSSRKVTPEDSLFFVSKTGGLLQLTVALRKLKWKDCRNPLNVKIKGIIDQETFRENIVFVVGNDGRLYQYNKVTGLWHGHHQSQHMVLSRQPGTAMRPWSKSLTGSLFMISEDGRLVEYHRNQIDGWGWVEHGTPWLGVTLVGSTGPCIGGTHLFVTGSNGNVYLRFFNLDQQTWKWSDCGFPNQEYKNETDDCDPKVSATRPIQFMENSVVFELRDGRLAEMLRTEDLHWVWWRTIGTPVSRCGVVYWTAIAS